MKKKLLIVVDYQNDFVSGSLGCPQAVAIEDALAAKIAAHRALGEGGQVIFTMDTHDKNYLETQEGKNLPVKHCIKGTNGWQIRKEIAELVSEEPVDKLTFGSDRLPERLRKLADQEPIESITLVGLCTDICVISNAMVIKAFFPEVPIIVDAKCCAGVTPESHTQALNAMKVCQIQIENE